MRQIRTKGLLLSLAILAWSPITGTPVAAQQDARVDVLIGFDRTPGPNERALVRAAGGTIRFSYHLVPGIAANVPEAALPGLLNNPRLTTIELDGKVYAVDTEMNNSWGVKHIGAGDVHPINKGTGVKLAIIDSGIYYPNPDLTANFAGGWDFVNNDNDPIDDNGHGTHVAGSAGALDNDSGVVGVAPEVSLYGLKILAVNNSGSWSRVIAALQWAVDHGMDVTNNSYGSGLNPGSLVEQAFDNAYAAGVISVASAGNSGNCAGTGDTVGWPAGFASVIAVAATDSFDVKSCLSSQGPAVEFAAPGEGIYSTYLDGYATMSGTSMASPHVAGTAALVIAAGASGPDTVRQILTSTALDLGSAGRDELYGHGLVDAAAAVAAVTGPPPVDTPPLVTLTNPLDGDTLSDTVTVTADASDDDGVAQVVFTVNSSTIGIDTDGSDGWSAGWDTTGWPDGMHNVTAEAADTINQTAVDSVTVDVFNPVPPVDTPPLVALTNPLEGDTLSGTVTITADAVDDDGVTQVVFTVNSTTIGTDTNGSDGWSAVWDTTAFPDGMHNVTAEATDTINQTAVDSVTVDVFNPVPPVDTPPLVTLTNPFEGDILSGTVTITADAVDDDGVTQVVFTVNSTTIGTDTNGSDGWSAVWDTTAFPDGTHTVTATATDTTSQTAADLVTVDVFNPMPAQGMHVGDLDGSSTNQGKYWTANAIVTLHDADHFPVAGATASGSWGAGDPTPVSCVTDSGGQCTVSSTSLLKKLHDATFTVGDVSHASLNYEPGDNHDPDGDSSGMSIVVQK